MAQQTAVEYLIGYMSKNEYFIGNDLLEAFEQAKQMEKEQIEKAYTEGVFSILEWMKEEHYYNETYGK